MQMPTVSSRCHTCMTPNPSPVTCQHCHQNNMCTMCETAGICRSCREAVQNGTMTIEKKEETEKLSGAEKTEAMRMAWGVLGKLQQVVPALVPSLGVLTRLTEKDFDELLNGLK